jgi:hypothetical protein
MSLGYDRLPKSFDLTERDPRLRCRLEQAAHSEAEGPLRPQVIRPSESVGSGAGNSGWTERASSRLVYSILLSAMSRCKLVGRRSLRRQQTGNLLAGPRRGQLQCFINVDVALSHATGGVPQERGDR